MWREVPFLWTNWPGPSQMMRRGRNRWPLIAERVCRKDPFFSQAAVTVGYANGLLTDWRQNCHFPIDNPAVTIREWFIVWQFFCGILELNLISMQEGRTSVKFRSKARLIDNRCHWEETQIMHWKWISNGTNQISNTRLCYWLDWWGKCLLISAQLLA